MRSSWRSTDDDRAFVLLANPSWTPPLIHYGRLSVHFDSTPTPSLALLNSSIDVGHVIRNIHREAQHRLQHLRLCVNSLVIAHLLH